MADFQWAGDPEPIPVEEKPKKAYVGKDLAGVQPDVADRFEAMATDYQVMTGEPLRIDDSFRTEAQQAEGYRRKPNLVAKSGYSNHPRGRALDIDETQAHELDTLGLMTEYGFHRPMMGQGKSGKYEPWHIEPVSDFEKRAPKIAATVKQGIKWAGDPEPIPQIQWAGDPEPINPPSILDRAVNFIDKNIIKQPGSAEEALSQPGPEQPKPVSAENLTNQATGKGAVGGGGSGWGGDQKAVAEKQVFAPDIAADLNARNAKLAESAKQLDESNKQLQAMKGSIDNTSQADIDAFNEAVKSHNALLGQHNAGVQETKGQFKKYQRLFGEYQKDPETFYTKNPQYAPEGWTLEGVQKDRANLLAAEKQGYVVNPATGMMERPAQAPVQEDMLKRHLAGDNRLPVDRTGVLGAIDKVTGYIGKGLSYVAANPVDAMGNPLVMPGNEPPPGKDSRYQAWEDLKSRQKYGEDYTTGAIRGYASGRSFGAYQPPKLSLEEQAKGVEAVQSIASFVGSGQNIAKLSGLTAFQGIPGAMETGLIFSIFEKAGTVAGKGLAGEQYQPGPGMVGAGGAWLAKYLGQPEVAAQIVDYSTKFEPVETALFFGAAHLGINAAIKGLTKLFGKVGEPTTFEGQQAATLRDDLVKAWQDMRPGAVDPATGKPIVPSDEVLRSWWSGLQPNIREFVAKNSQTFRNMKEYADSQGWDIRSATATGEPPPPGGGTPPGPRPLLTGSESPSEPGMSAPQPQIGPPPSGPPQLPGPPGFTMGPGSQPPDFTMGPSPSNLPATRGAAQPPAVQPQNAFEDYILQTGGHQGDPAAMASDLLEKRGPGWAFSPQGMKEISLDGTQTKHFHKELALVFSSMHPELAGQVRPDEIYQHLTPEDMQAMAQLPRGKMLLERLNTAAVQRMTEAQGELQTQEAQAQQKFMEDQAKVQQKEAEAAAKVQQKEFEAQVKEQEKAAQTAAEEAKKAALAPKVDTSRPAIKNLFTPKQLQAITHEQEMAMEPDLRKKYNQEKKDYLAKQEEKGAEKKKPTIKRVKKVKPQPEANVAGEVGVEKPPAPTITPASNVQQAAGEGGAKLGSEFGLKGLAAKQYTVDGNIMGKTPEEAVAAYQKESGRQADIAANKAVFNELAPKLRAGTYTEFDLKRITTYGKTSVSTGEAEGILQDLGLRPVDAKKFVRASGDIATTSRGAIIYDLGRVIETARRNGYLPEVAPLEGAPLSKAKRERELAAAQAPIEAAGAKEAQAPAPEAAKGEGGQMSLFEPKVTPRIGPTLATSQRQPNALSVWKLTRSWETPLEPRGQKKFALEAVDKALKGPFREDGGESHVLIDIPGDGEYRIINDKYTLDLMKKKFGSFPVGNVKPETYRYPSTEPTGRRPALGDGVEYATDYIPRPADIVSKKPIVEYEKGQGWANGYYSDGKSLIKMDKPKAPLDDRTSKMIPDFIDRLPKDEGTPAIIEGEHKGPYDSFITVILRSGDTRVMVQAKYMDAILTKHPDAKPFITEKDRPVIFWEGKDLAGAVMPMNPGPTGFEGFDALKEAKAEPGVGLTSEQKTNLQQSNEKMFQDLVKFSADTPEHLRASDLDRVVKEAEERGVGDEFVKWLGEQSLNERARKEFNLSYPELADPAPTPKPGEGKDFKVATSPQLIPKTETKTLYKEKLNENAGSPGRQDALHLEDGGRARRELETFKAGIVQGASEGTKRIWANVEHSETLRTSPAGQAILANAQAQGIAHVHFTRNAPFAGSMTPTRDGYVMTVDETMDRMDYPQTAGHETFHFHRWTGNPAADKLYSLVDQKSPAFKRFMSDLNYWYGDAPLSAAEIAAEIAADFGGAGLNEVTLRDGTKIPITSLFKTSVGAKLARTRYQKVVAGGLAERRTAGIGEPKYAGLTSTKNAVTEEERRVRGLDPVQKELFQIEPGAAEAKRLVDEGIGDPRELAAKIAKSINSGKQYPITDVEGAMLMYDRMRLYNAESSLMDDLEAALAEGGNVAAVRQRLAQVADALDLNDRAVTHAGTVTSASFRMRQYFITEDYSLARILNRARAAHPSGELPDALREKLTALTLELQAANKKLEAYEKGKAEKKVKGSVKDIETRINRAIKKGEAQKKPKTEAMANFKSLAAKFRDTLGQLNMLLGGNQVALLAEMAKELVIAGITDAREIVNTIFDELDIPDLSKRDVEEALSGYGKVSKPSQDEIDKALREVRRQIRLFLSLEDALSGQMPLRTGLQRDPVSDEVRRLTQEVKQAMRDAGIDSTASRTPEEQWKTSLDAAKARLNNQIRDNTKRLADLKAGRPVLKKKGGITYDQEATDLKAENDLLRAAIREIEGKPGMSDEQKLRMATEAVERSIANWEKRISEGDLAPAKKGTTTRETPQLHARRAYRDRLRKVHQQMVKDARPTIDPEVAANRRYHGYLLRRDAQLQNMLDTDNFEKSAKRVLNLDPENQTLKANVEAKKQKIDEAILKRKMEARTTYAKGLDWGFKFRRGVILSGVGTLGKLAAAATMRQISTPAEDFVGAAIRTLPYMKQVFSLAPTEGGGVNVRAEAAGFVQWLKKQTWQESWGILKMQPTELELLYGKHRPHMPPTMLDWFGHMHQALKNPIKRVIFYRTLQRRTEWAMSHGLDMTEPANIMSIASSAYLEANRAIFMNDNFLSNAFLGQIRKWKNSGEPGLQSLAFLLHSLMPIVKVPTNFTGEVLSYTVGPILAASRYYNKGGAKGAKLLAEHVREHPNQAFNLPKAFKGMTTEDADYIVRNMKKGGLGSLLFWLGMAASASIGGYWIYGEKRKLTEVKPGEIRLFGINISHLFLHHPAIFGPLMLGSTIVRVMKMTEEYNKAHPDKDKGSGLAEGVHAGGMGILKGIPFIDTPIRIAKAAESWPGMGKFANQLAESLVIPPDLRRISKATDKAGDELIPRETKTLGQTLQGSIPGQRSKLPVDINKFKYMGIDRMAEIVEKAPPGTFTPKDAEVLTRNMMNKLKAADKKGDLTPADEARYERLIDKLDRMSPR